MSPEQRAAMAVALLKWESTPWGRDGEDYGAVYVRLHDEFVRCYREAFRAGFEAGVSALSGERT